MKKLFIILFSMLLTQQSVAGEVVPAVMITVLATFTSMVIVGDHQDYQVETSKDGKVLVTSWDRAQVQAVQIAADDFLITGQKSKLLNEALVEIKRKIPEMKNYSDEKIAAIILTTPI